VKTDPKNEGGTNSRLKPSDLPPLRRVTVADVQKVESLLRARRNAGS